MMLGVVGLIAKSEHPNTERGFEFVAQDVPPFVETHIPPAPVPKYMVVEIVG